MSYPNAREAKGEGLGSPLLTFRQLGNAKQPWNFRPA